MAFHPELRPSRCMLPWRRTTSTAPSIRKAGHALPRAFLRALRRAGGELHVRTPVSKILLEGGRAIGVRLADGREVRASRVVSNTDPRVTFERLVGRDALSEKLKQRLGKTKYSISMMSLFVAADMDVRSLGLDSGNYWYTRDTNINASYDAVLAGQDVEKDLPGLFLTVTSFKDPSKKKKGHHPMESFAFASYESFERWAGTKMGERPKDYERLKQDLTGRMLKTLERIVPGLERHLTFCELGTPLTNEYYCESTRGNVYGTEKSRRQIGPFGFGVKTDFPGLYMCEASTLGHGIAGATVSGLIAAARALGCRTRDLLRPTGQKLKVLSSEEAGSEDEADENEFEEHRDAARS
jgi:phytoene dehydrogenase-like protein